MNTSNKQTRKCPIRLDLPEGIIEAGIELPHGPMRLVDLAAIVLGLSSTVADMGARITSNLGRQVSCSKGCGVCCRQLVPLSPPEAIMLAELVISMPKDIRTRIQNRFATAVRQLERSGLLETLARLQDSSSLSDEDMQALTKEYFLQQIRFASGFYKQYNCVSQHYNTNLLQHPAAVRQACRAARPRC